MLDRLREGRGRAVGNSAAAALRRLMLACGGIVGLTAAIAPQAQARIDPAAPTLEQRRAILDERVASASARLEREAASPTAGERVAQWPNWPNYWHSWPNWRNWRAWR